MLILIPLGFDTSLIKRKLIFKIFITGCRAIQSHLLDQPSPIIGLIESSEVPIRQEVGASGTSQEGTSRAEKSAPSTKQVPPSATTNDAATAAAASGGEAGGSGRSGVRVVPFQSLLSSTQEDLGKELFHDSLLTLENIQKLTDYMQWSFKFTKVCLLPSVLLYIE